MKNLLIITLLITSNLFGQKNKTITTLEGLKEYNKKAKYYDSLRDNFKPNNYIDSVLIYLNKYRIENNVQPLKLNDDLSKVAELQAKYCADKSILTHYQENEDYKDCYNRGLHFNEYVGGEIALQHSFEWLTIDGGTIPLTTIESFKTSSAHSFLMRHENFKRCGISMVQSEKNKENFYVIIVFSEY